MNLAQDHRLLLDLSKETAHHSMNLLKMSRQEIRGECSPYSMSPSKGDKEQVACGV
jgi:hypothetical protein